GRGGGGRSPGPACASRGSRSWARCSTATAPSRRASASATGTMKPTAPRRASRGPPGRPAPPDPLMIDLHCHILPGVDDGARSFAEAVAICRLAADVGCEGMVAAPHQRRGEWWNADRGELAALADQLQTQVGPGFRVHLGGEIHVDSELLDEVEKLPAGGGVLPLAGSRYLLI